MKITMLLSRLAIGMCGMVVGAYCSYTAFRNGQMLAPGLDGIAFGSAFSSVVVGSWFLLPLAAQSPSSRAIIMRAGWALCLAFVLINAIGFTATHRTHTVGDKANAITIYDMSLTSLKNAQERLTALKANARWAKTSGCSDATAERSIEFCRQVQQAQADVASNQAVVTAGKPATADAQADTIAWATQIDTAVVSRGLPIFMAVVLDVAASMFIWVAMTVYTGVRVAEHIEKFELPNIEVPVETPVAEPIAPAPVAKVRKPRKKPARKTAAQVDALKKAVGAFQPVGLTKAGKPDRRRKTFKRLNDQMAIASNDN